MTNPTGALFLLLVGLLVLAAFANVASVGGSSTLASELVPGNLEARDAFGERNERKALSLRLAKVGQGEIERKTVLPEGGAPALIFDHSDLVTIRGRLVTQHGFPVVGARVQGDAEEVTTDRNGRFSLQSNGSGSPCLLLQAPEFATCKVPLRLRSDQAEYELQPLVMLPACTLKITVGGVLLDDSSGADLILQRVSDPSPSSFPRKDLWIGSGESLDLNKLPPGEFFIEATDEFGNSGSCTVRLNPRFESSAHIDLESRAMVAGRE